MLLTGMGYYALLVGIVTGLLAELVYKRGDYKSVQKAVLTSGVFSMWVWANFIPLFTNIEGYFSTRQDFGQEYINTLTSLMPTWMCPTLLVASFVSGIIGGLVGKAILKKHFIKAGIA
jgi:energy-coupling factor transport system substrate-specific component